MTGRFAWLLPAALVAMAAVVPSHLREELLRPSGGRTAGDALAAELGRHPEFALGFRSVIGDMVWLKAVQVAGERRLSRRDGDELAALVNTVIDFDPRFVVPYLLGGLVLSDSRYHTAPALHILERGRANHPRDWRFPFYIGYVTYFSLGKPLEGGRFLQEASLLPDSPPYLPLLASRMLTEGRAPETALMFLAGMLKQEKDPARREVLGRRIREVIVERDIQGLEKAVAEYRARTGVFPGALEDLVRGGILGRLPAEPHGGHYVLGSDGSVRSDRVERRLRVFRKDG